MTDRRNVLLMELESLQTQRREAVEAYVESGNRSCWREVRETSEAIANKLKELEEVRCTAENMGARLTD